MPEHLTLDTFKEKIFDFESEKEWKFKGDRPVIIDFYADWCGPCKMVSPIVEELAQEFDGQIDVYKIDTEDQQMLAGMFGISSIPSLLFIPMEGQPTMAMGAMPKPGFYEAIEKVFGLYPPQNN